MFWLTWSANGKWVYSSTGDIIDATTKTVVAQLMPHAAEVSPPYSIICSRELTSPPQGARPREERRSLNTLNYSKSALETLLCPTSLGMNKAPYCGATGFRKTSIRANPRFNGRYVRSEIGATTSAPTPLFRLAIAIKTGNRSLQAQMRLEF
jgi:hypothetical protein